MECRLHVVAGGEEALICIHLNTFDTLPVYTLRYNKIEFWENSCLDLLYCYENIVFLPVIIHSCVSLKVSIRLF